MRSKMKQLLTYWAPQGLNGYGDQVFAAPEQLFGHWEDKAEQVRKSSGEEVISKATVHTSAAVEEGGFLAKGDFFTTPVTPDAAGAEEIQATMEIPSMRTNQSEYRAML